MKDAQAAGCFCKAVEMSNEYAIICAGGNDFACIDEPATNGTRNLAQKLVGKSGVW